MVRNVLLLLYRCFFLLAPCVHAAQPSAVLEAISLGISTVFYIKGCTVGNLMNGGRIPVAETEELFANALTILSVRARDRIQLIEAPWEVLAWAAEFQQAADKEF